MSIIVVVEDDASMSQAIERLLHTEGFVAVMMSSAEAALEADAARIADCLILDIHLPGMSGFDLYRRVTESGKDLPAIFITAHDERANREEARRMGASSYLPKPFSGRALLDAVTCALRSH